MSSFSPSSEQTEGLWENWSLYSGVLIYVSSNQKVAVFFDKIS